MLATTVILVLLFAGCAYADGVIRTNETPGEEPAPEVDTSDNATSDEPWIIAPNPNVAAKDDETPDSVDEPADQGIIPRNAPADERDSNATKGDVPVDDTTIGTEDSVIAPSGQVDDAIPGEGSSTRLLFAVPLICGALVAAALGVAHRRR